MQCRDRGVGGLDGKCGHEVMPRAPAGRLGCAGAAGETGALGLAASLWRRTAQGMGRGLRLAPSTISSYAKNVRLHLQPLIGSVRLGASTGGRLKQPTTPTTNKRTAWLLLIVTGMRRGEALALRWRDVDFDAGTISVRRSVETVKNKGERQIVEGPTKNGKTRVVDIDAGTASLLRAYRATRAGVAFQLGRADALLFGDVEGKHRLPESFFQVLPRVGRSLHPLADRRIREG